MSDNEKNRSRYDGDYWYETNDRKRKKKQAKRRSGVGFAVIMCVLVLCAVAALFVMLRGIAFAHEVRDTAGALKEDAKQIFVSALSSRPDETDASIAAFDRDTKKLKELMDSPLGRLSAKIPGFRTEMKSAYDLIVLAGEASDSLLKPFAALQHEHPVSDLKKDGGYDTELIRAYLEFAEKKMPELEQLTASLLKVDLGALDRGGKIAGYREKLEKLIDAYHSYERYIPLARAFIGEGEDKLYFFAAQNSSEIRSSGGFPGSVGVVRIQDGILHIGEFGTVKGVLYFYNTEEVKLTNTEIILSDGWMGNGPRDADFSPDFERVAEIWSIGYRDQNGERPDGVISATPAIIQRLLRVLGDITLSDGTVLNGENAVRVLEYDLYYRYMGANSDTSAGNRTTDGLYAETVEKLMEKLSFSGNFSQALQLASVLEESASDRTLMLWFPEEEKQQLVRELGLACSLNKDPANPEAGVYFSLADPGRMGWFLDMDAEAEELGTREDGSKDYAITVTLRNVMTQEELEAASDYIKGVNHPGRVYGYLYLFAPSGGEIGEVESSDRAVSFRPEEYRGLSLRYTHGINLRIGESVTFRYTVTTAPGEQAPLGFSMTPTLQSFR